MGRSTRRYRSQSWFAGSGPNPFMYRSWMRILGVTDDAFDRPVIGICNTWSDLTPCNSNLRELAEHVRQGVQEAGGFAVEFPVMSLGESNMRPTAMMFRNLVSMAVEESIRANPLDGIVLLAGCDKTTPALLMGAASCDLPTIVLSTGPSLAGKLHGRRLGAGTDVWRLFEQAKVAGKSAAMLAAAEAAMNRTTGTCNTMGSASTMACLTEALGIALSGNAALPAVDSRRRGLARLTGRRIVQLVEDDVKLSRFLTRPAFENAVRATLAIGGSTNAVIHLTALARRAGVPLALEEWTRLGRGVPTLVNLMPSGEYLMEDFFDAGGMPVVLKMLDQMGLLHGGVPTVTGPTLGEVVADAQNYDGKVIRSPAQPVSQRPAIAVLKGSLAPGGAIMKVAAASAHLLEHRGRAVVFESIEDYHRRIDDPALAVDPTSILVLKGCGPQGYPGMAEVGNIALPRKLLAAGVTDLVRISDARMSGTAYGTVVLHVTPEAAVGGPLAAVRDGDEIELDVAAGRLDLRVPAEELQRRLQSRGMQASVGDSGYERLYRDHVLQADGGCDFDFLAGARGAEVARDCN